MELPGDDLITGGGSVTRAIGIEASAADVWPWLVQLGFGRAGWYSYDWIDNDGHPSADAIMPKYQNLEIGDKILMMPEMGFEVTSIDPERSIVGKLGDGTTSWCLAVSPQEDGSTRLLSRWRNKWGKITAANAIRLIATARSGGRFVPRRSAVPVGLASRHSLAMSARNWPVVNIGALATVRSARL